MKTVKQIMINRAAKNLQEAKKLILQSMLDMKSTEPEAFDDNFLNDEFEKVTESIHTIEQAANSIERKLNLLTKLI